MSFPCEWDLKPRRRCCALLEHHARIVYQQACKLVLIVSLQICLSWILYHAPQSCVMWAHGIVSMLQASLCYVNPHLGNQLCAVKVCRYTV